MPERVEPAVRLRVRIYFAKKGRLRFLGHRDLVRAMERLFRRAGLRLGMSQGFHPKPRMTFPLALAVGIEGAEEVMELELAEQYDAAAVLKRLQTHAFEGLEFLSVELLPPGTKKIRISRATYELVLPEDRREQAARRAGQLMAEATHPVRRKRNGKEFDLRPSVERLEVAGDRLQMTLACGEGQGQTNASPREVLEAVGLDDLAGRTSFVRSSVLPSNAS